MMIQWESDEERRLVTELSQRTIFSVPAVLDLYRLMPQPRDIYVVERAIQMQVGSNGVISARSMLRIT